MDEPRWSLLTRVAFRFFFTLLVLIYFPFPITAVRPFNLRWSAALNNLLARAAHAVSGATISATYNGSGDRMIDWVRFGTIVALSVIVTIVWSILDRRRAGYPTLYRWFRLYIRFALATAMITYGAYKVIPAQFVTPSLDRLLEPIGDQSPMGMLWNFMGASMPYTIFAGVGELVGGLLLTNRRTALLGALITAAVMSQVVMLNFSYDVPVKIYSSELLLTAIVLIARDAEKLFRFFLPDAPTPATHRFCRIALVLFVAYVTVTRLHEAWKDRREYDDEVRNQSPLAGIWNVDNGAPLPWRRLIIAEGSAAAIEMTDGTQTRYWLTADEKKKSIALQRRANTLTLAYERPDARTLLLRGLVGGRAIAATLHKDTQRTFLLTSRGFHWVNEWSFNR